MSLIWRLSRPEWRHRCWWRGSPLWPRVEERRSAALTLFLAKSFSDVFDLSFSVPHCEIFGFGLRRGITRSACAARAPVQKGQVLPAQLVPESIQAPPYVADPEKVRGWWNAQIVPKSALGCPFTEQVACFRVGCGLCTHLQKKTFCIPGRNIPYLTLLGWRPSLLGRRPSLLDKIYVHFLWGAKPLRWRRDRSNASCWKAGAFSIGPGWRANPSWPHHGGNGQRTTHLHLRPWSLS